MPELNTHRIYCTNESLNSTYFLLLNILRDIALKEHIDRIELLNSQCRTPLTHTFKRSVMPELPHLVSPPKIRSQNKPI